jgi:hypothetical protein
MESGAARVGLCARTLSRAIERGELTKYRQGIRVYVDANEVDAWAVRRASITPERVAREERYA